MNNLPPSSEDSENPLALIYSRQDAESLFAGGLTCRAVLAMTPNAQAALAGCSHKIIVSTSVLDDRAHLKIVARTRRLDRAIQNLLEHSTGIAETAKITLASDLHYMAASALGLWIMLGRRGPWLVPMSNGQWTIITSRIAALTALVTHLRRTGSPVRAWLQVPALANLVRALNRSAVRISARDCQVAIPGRSYGMANLAEEIFKRHAKRTVEVRGATGNWHDFIHPLRTLYQALTGQAIITAIAAPKSQDNVKFILEKVWSGIPDVVVREGLMPYRNEIITESMLTQSLADEMAEILNGTAVQSIMLNALHWGADVALAEAAGRHGLPRFLISHGSHTLGHTLAADAEQRALAEGQLVSPLADIAITQSPYGDALAADMNPALERRPYRPSMWGYKKLPQSATAPRTRQILHAGTYKKLIGLRPWIYETSNEFTDGLVDLIHAVEGVGDTHLIIRFRPMAECDLDALRKLLPRSDCYEIKISGSFLDDLAATDLLVSYASTTIEESLNARRPVLLWGGTRRYRHVPAETAPPSVKRRASVYTAEGVEHLSNILPAILDCHAGKPLTDIELAGHVWPFGTPGVSELADAIADAQALA
jgi:hypothetical protein